MASPLKEHEFEKLPRDSEGQGILGATVHGGYVHEFGVRKGQVQILIQIATSCVEL